MTRFSFTINVEAEKSDGKFVGKDELQDLVIGDLEGADPGILHGDEGTYDVVVWEVIPNE